MQGVILPSRKRTVPPPLNPASSLSSSSGQKGQSQSDTVQCGPFCVPFPSRGQELEYGQRGPKPSELWDIPSGGFHPRYLHLVNEMREFGCSVNDLSPQFSSDCAAQAVSSYHSLRSRLESAQLEFDARYEDDQAASHDEAKFDGQHPQMSESQRRRWRARNKASKSHPAMPASVEPVSWQPVLTQALHGVDADYAPDPQLPKMSELSPLYDSDTLGQPCVILLIRSHDVRIIDNEALALAAAHNVPVIPLFLWTTDAEEGRWSVGLAARWWLQVALGRYQDLWARHFGAKKLAASPLFEFSDLLPDGPIPTLSANHAPAILWMSTNRLQSTNQPLSPHSSPTWMLLVYAIYLLRRCGLHTQSVICNAHHEPWLLKRDDLIAQRLHDE